MKLNRKTLKKMIVEEVNRLHEWTGDEMEAAKGDVTQQYIDFIVRVQEAAGDALERIEQGEEPYSASHDSRFKTLVEGYRDEEFYDYFYG